MRLKINYPLLMNRLIYLLTVLFLAGSVFAADPADDIDRGPFLTGTIKAQFPGPNTAMKGIVVTLGENKKSYLCFDTDLLRVSVGWTGDFLRFGNGQTRIEHPQPPQVAGTPQFGTRPGPGWAINGAFDDPRSGKQGPLPKEVAHYRGLYLNGRQVVFAYTIGKAEVLESPSVVDVEGQPVFIRTLRLDKSGAQTLLVCEDPRSNAQIEGDLAVLQPTDGGDLCTAAAIIGDRAAKLGSVGNRLVVQLPASNRARTLQVAIWHGAKHDLAKFANFVSGNKQSLPDLVKLTKGGAPRWSETLTTKGTLSNDKAPYVSDILTESLPNPWNAKTFFGGFDFFPDGRAAICTFHGDVWIVSGIDEKLDKLTWKRFATGMFQPLGLKIVNNTIYVTCRDQINRLHDLNKDGEADFYENFNNEMVVTDNYHEFALDLDTDSAGNFRSEERRVGKE